MNTTSFWRGAVVMTVGALIFVIYGLAFLYRAIAGEGFEIGVHTLNGVTVSELNELSPAIMPYIDHLHIATAGFIIATGVAVAALSWYGVRQGILLAWVTAVVTPVIGLVVALPMHWFDYFQHDWVSHLGAIYVGTLIFVIGALIALRGFVAERSGESRRKT